MTFLCSLFVLIPPVQQSLLNKGAFFHLLDSYKICEVKVYDVVLCSDSQ